MLLFKILTEWSEGLRQQSWNDLCKCKWSNLYNEIDRLMQYSIQKATSLQNIDSKMRIIKFYELIFIIYIETKNKS